MVVGLVVEVLHPLAVEGVLHLASGVVEAHCQEEEGVVVRHQVEVAVEELPFQASVEVVEVLPLEVVEEGELPCQVVEEVVVVHQQ